ncbi:UNVERIFIED_CONTAM: hypothetical protein FKN15_001719 [Acipenser sinensis]
MYYKRVKTKTSSKYGLSAQPRLVDIIAAVPPQHRRALVPKLKAKPIRTASGESLAAHSASTLDPLLPMRRVTTCSVSDSGIAGCSLCFHAGSAAADETRHHLFRF